MTPYDDVALKSPFGNFLIVEPSSTISASGPNITEDSTFKLLKANIPFLPDWVVKRQHLNHNNLFARSKIFYERSAPFKRKAFEEEPQPLGGFPTEIQETFLIEDLLFAMSSIEGVYIRRKKVDNSIDGISKFNYQVEPYLENSTCDFSLLYLVGKVLPMCNNHDRVCEFIKVHSQFEFGLVSHALCSAIKVLLKEYLLLVTQLDTEFMKGDLTLQKLWFYSQPSLKILENLNKLTLESTNKKGGALLNVIYKYMMNSSDRTVKELFSFLLEKAAQPYLDVL